MKNFFDKKSSGSYGSDRSSGGSAGGRKFGGGFGGGSRSGGSSSYGGSSRGGSTGGYSGGSRGGSTGGYGGGSRGGSGGGYGGSSSGGWQRNEDRGERPTMHRATCDQCHSSCEVPFRPTGEKPVYCRDCFRGQDAGSSAPRFSAPRSDRSSSFEKPAFRSESAGRSNNDDIVKQLKALNAKFDQLLQALSEFTTEEGDEFEDEEMEMDLEDGEMEIEVAGDQEEVVEAEEASSDENVSFDM